MAPKTPHRRGGKDKSRKKYSKPRIERHGELSRTALAHSY